MTGGETMALKEHGKYALISALIIIGQASAAPMRSAPQKNVVFHFHLFAAEAEPGTKPTEISIFTEETEPKLSQIKAILNNVGSDITAKTIDYLLEKFDLNDVTEYFAYSVGWEGKRATYNHNIEQRYHHFHMVLSPVLISPETLELGYTLNYGAEDPVKYEERINKLKKGQYEKPDFRWDTIVETKFFLNIDGPILASIPAGGKTYFLLVYARRKGEKPKAVLATPITPPKELNMVIPAYPEELRKQGIQGTVELRVVTDESGSVAEIKVERPLHPYLDFAAVQAVRESKLAAIRILGRDAQAFYFFSFVKMDSVKGSRSFVLQAVPKPGNLWGVESARVWVAQNDGRVLRIEIQGVPVEGYEDVLNDGIQFRVRPYLVTTHVLMDKIKMESCFRRARLFESNTLGGGISARIGLSS